MPGDERGSSGAVKRFSGKSPEEYRIWKRWAKAHMISKGAKLELEERGPLLYTYLDDTAVAVLDDLEIEELNVWNGADVLFRLLDARYPERTAVDMIGEALDAVFSLGAKPGEETAEYVGVVRTTFAKAHRQQMVFNEETRGYMMLQQAGLSRAERATILAMTARSYREYDIAEALRTAYPKTLP